MRGIPTITIHRHFELLESDLDYPVWLKRNKGLGRVVQLWPLDPSLTLWRALAIYDENDEPYGITEGGDPVRIGIIVSTTPAKQWWLQPDRGDD